MKNSFRLFILLLPALLLYPEVCHAHNSVSMGYGLFFILGSAIGSVVDFYLIIINFQIRKLWLSIVSIILLLPQLWLIYFVGSSGGSFSLWAVLITVVEIGLIIGSIVKRNKTTI